MSYMARHQYLVGGGFACLGHMSPVTMAGVQHGFVNLQLATRLAAALGKSLDLEIIARHSL